MAKIICRGWRKEPDEGSQQAYDVLTGRKKRFYVVFGRKEALKNQSEKDLENQTEYIENESER